MPMQPSPCAETRSPPKSTEVIVTRHTLPRANRRSVTDAERGVLFGGRGRTTGDLIQLQHESVVANIAINRPRPGRLVHSGTWRPELGGAASDVLKAVRLAVGGKQHGVGVGRTLRPVID